MIKLIKELVSMIIPGTGILFHISLINLQALPDDCTHSPLMNFNIEVIKNNECAFYSTDSVSPDESFDLDSALHETSGLIFWDNQLWTHNDNADINLYSLDTLNGNYIKSFPLTGTLNIDWEEIAQDDEYVYIGDFGNNSSGNRTDLKILRVRKNSIRFGTVKIDTINFSYSDQTNFSSAGANKTDFDCEAFIISSDSIYLFTKQWTTKGTNLYSLPKNPGTYIAEKKSSYDIDGLITGATYLRTERLIALCGYSSRIDPFIYLLYDFNGSDFFGGNKRKIFIPLSFYQIEGIATKDGLKYYLSNEYLSYYSLVTVSQKLHIVDLSSYVGDYLASVSSGGKEIPADEIYYVYPVPSGDLIKIKRNNSLSPEKYSLMNYSGQKLLEGIFSGEENQIDISSLPVGLYILKIGNRKSQCFKVIRD